MPEGKASSWLQPNPQDFKEPGITVKKPPKNRARGIEQLGKVKKKEK